VPRRKPEVTEMTARRDSVADSSVSFASVGVGRIVPTKAYGIRSSEVRYDARTAHVRKKPGEGNR